MIMAIEKLNKTYQNDLTTKLNAQDFQENVDKIDEVVGAVNNVTWEWIGTVGAGETKTIALTTGRMWLLALYNDYGNFGFYILNKATAGTQGIRIETIKASSLITISPEGTSSIKIVAGQIACPMYLMKIN